MIITDSSKRPSERLIEIVGNYFSSREFVYKKSKNQFSRTRGNRIEMVSIFYNKTGNLVSATLSWAVLFPDLEKAYKKIQLESWYKGETTLWTDLLNYKLRRSEDAPSSFDLFDIKSFRYDDFSINKAATELLISFETYVQPFFEHYKDLKALESEMNLLPINHHKYIGFGGRQISVGLILCKLMNRSKYDELIEKYRQYILDDKEDADFKDKMLLYLSKTIEYLNTVDIEKAIRL